METSTAVRQVGRCMLVIPAVFSRTPRSLKLAAFSAPLLVCSDTSLCKQSSTCAISQYTASGMVQK